MKNILLILLLIHLFAYGLCSPLNQAEFSFSSSDVLVNCNNRDLVSRMKATGIPFRCRKELSEAPKKFIHSENLDKGTVENQLMPQSPNNLPKESAEKGSISSTRDFNKCPDGSMFNPSVGICLELPKKPSKFSPGGPTLPKRCRHGFVHSPETGRCEPDEPDVSGLVNDYPQKINVDAWQAGSRCKKGEVYNPSVDLCLLDPGPAPPKKESYKLEAFMSDDPTIPSRITFKEGLASCPPGKVYNSEIDRCT